MTTWKDGGDYGRFSREIISEDNSRGICFVWTKQEVSGIRNDTEPWPEGKANFALILKAPVLLKALCSIRDTAECFLQPLPVGCVAQVRWRRVRDRAVAAIEAVKGEDDENVKDCNAKLV